MKNLKEQLMHLVFLLSACVSILCVAMICVFLFANGIPAIGKIGVFQFLAGEKWKPGNDLYGILPMILGSIYVTAGAVIIGVPIGILTAVFMSKFCPRRIYKVVKPAIDLLAGIPSVVYGFFGMVVIVPVVSQLFGGSGKSMLTASILLGIMILRPSSAYRNLPSTQCRPAITRVPWPWVPAMSAAYSLPRSRLQNPVFWPV